MEYYYFTEQEILDKTRSLIHTIANNQMEDFLSYFDKDLVWLGDYDSLYTHGLPAFQDSLRAGAQKPSVEIMQEEYTLLAKERRLWVTYGRFSAKPFGSDTDSIKVHFTFVWKQFKNTVRLIHANACHANNMLPDSDYTDQEQTASPLKSFSRIQTRVLSGETAGKIRIRDLSGSVHYLFPAEVIYIKSNDKICTIHTEKGAFNARTTLRDMANPQFLLIHRSHLVNKHYVQEIRRYQATLADGTKLPISQDRYMNVKHDLLEA